MDLTKVTLALAMALLLTSCATLQSDLPHQKQACQAQQQSLPALDAWRWDGRIGLRRDNAAWSAHVRWDQRSKHQYRLDFQAPLGAGAARLVKNRSGVILTTSKGVVESAPSAEQLLAQQWGWRLPVHHLFYWLRGLPAPGRSLSACAPVLNQAGWRVEYLAYRSFSNWVLPTKIRLTKAPWTVKIVIKEWQISNKKHD